jgi:hypothetical protein
LNTLSANSAVTVEIVARILNATDLNSLQLGEELYNFKGDPQGVNFLVKAENDADDSNNEVTAKVDIPFRSGSYEETRAAMEVLAPYFDYTTDKYFQQCNVYKDDIFDRLEQIRSEHPEVFANLSYGGISSGEYLVLGLDTPLTRAGHVGVVVYTKGTNFRETGIIINGTPSPSPINAHSEIGPADPGGGFGLGSWTGLNGLYLRTPANKFPGTPQQESNGAGFEGEYPDNATEFTIGGSAPEPIPPDAPMTCPIAPDAVMVTTHSPVEVIVTNSRGQRVETKDGQIVAQELGTGIQSMAFPHEDGTYAWTLVLPVDDYKVQLRGTRVGPYQLTLTTFAPDGTPTEKVTDGFTNPDQIDEYVLEAPEAAPVPDPDETSGNTDESGSGTGTGTGVGNVSQSSGGAKHGGGGAMGGWTLLALLLLRACWRTRASPRTILR